MKSILFVVNVVLLTGVAAGPGSNLVAARPQGPCDIYAEGGSPCVVAHSSTRALYASYNGPLYQVLRQSDGKTLDIGVVKASAGDPGVCRCGGPGCVLREYCLLDHGIV
ncbi:arabinofuranosidase catalytic domain-containing protein [Puia sp. P3]|uniref:arabinofuranosidase catalytic domain-containing protein n=1 Tax=Puia sp. P3 TaxID=3423952 RepID=UPI003D6731CC